MKNKFDDITTLALLYLLTLGLLLFIGSKVDGLEERVKQLETVQTK